MRGLCILPLMVVLSACASMAASEQPLAKVQNAVYRVEDKPAPTPASAKSEEAKPANATQASSKPVHLYWFLSGR